MDNERRGKQTSDAQYFFLGHFSLTQCSVVGLGQFRSPVPTMLLPSFLLCSFSLAECETHTHKIKVLDLR